MSGRSRYFEPGYLDGRTVAGCKMPTNRSIEAGDQLRAMEAEIGSANLLSAIMRLPESARG